MVIPVTDWYDPNFKNNFPCLLRMIKSCQCDWRLSRKDLAQRRRKSPKTRMDAKMNLAVLPNYLYLSVFHYFIRKHSECSLKNTSCMNFSVIYLFYPCWCLGRNSRQHTWLKLNDIRHQNNLRCHRHPTTFRSGVIGTSSHAFWMTVALALSFTHMFIEYCCSPTLQNYLYLLSHWNSSWAWQLEPVTQLEGSC